MNLVSASREESLERFVHPSFRARVEDLDGFARELRGRIQREGMARVENFIVPEFVGAMRASTELLQPQTYAPGGRKQLAHNELAGTPFGELGDSPMLRELACRILAGMGVDLDPNDQEIYPVLNILHGEQGQKGVRVFHFDSTYLTIAVPVTMPDPSNPRSGLFRIWPNIRPFSQSLVSNKLFWNLMKTSAARERLPNYSVSMRPGDLYLFFGFRSFHGVETLDPSSKRAMCLLNYGGPLYDRARGKRMKYPG